MRTFIATAEVARMLGVSCATLLRLRDRLEADDGFPQPVPHSRRPLRWRADQVAAWIDAQGLPRDPCENIDPALIRQGRVILMAEARRV